MNDRSTEPRRRVRLLRLIAVVIVALLAAATIGRGTLAAFMNWADATTNSTPLALHGIDRAAASLATLHAHLPTHGLIAYQTNRDVNTVAAGERLLHLRNAIAPRVLAPGDTQLFIVLIDLEVDADPRAYCQEHRLIWVATGDDGLSVAQRSDAP